MGEFLLFKEGDLVGHMWPAIHRLDILFYMIISFDL